MTSEKENKDSRSTLIVLTKLWYYEEYWRLLTNV